MLDWGWLIIIWTGQMQKHKIQQEGIEILCSIAIKCSHRVQYDISNDHCWLVMSNLFCFNIILNYSYQMVASGSQQPE